VAIGMRHAPQPDPAPRAPFVTLQLDTDAAGFGARAASRAAR
jgi:hypothetical protein